MAKTIEDVMRLCQTLDPAVLDVDQRILTGSALIDALSQIGFHLVRIDPAPIVDKKGLLNALKQQCQFPDYFGDNWDALKDSLCDFSWLPRRPAGFAFFFADPLRLSWTDLSVFLHIFEYVHSAWAAHNIPFKLLLPKTMKMPKPETGTTEKKKEKKKGTT